MCAEYVPWYAKPGCHWVTPTWQNNRGCSRRLRLGGRSPRLHPPVPSHKTLPPGSVGSGKVTESRTVTEDYRCGARSRLGWSQRWSCTSTVSTLSVRTFSFAHEDTHLLRCRLSLQPLPHSLQSFPSHVHYLSLQQLPACNDRRDCGGGRINNSHTSSGSTGCDP